MALLDAFREVWNFLAGQPGEVEVVEQWATDPRAFEEHFGESYDSFVEMLEHLNRPHFELFERTVKVNPEAAVTWVFFVA